MAGWLLLSCVVSFDTLVMAVSSVRYLASLVGMVTADGLVSQLLLDGFYPTCIVSSGWFQPLDTIQVG